MSDPFPFSPTPSSQFPENEPIYGWIAPPFPQNSFAPQGPSEATSNQGEISSASVVVPPEHSQNSKVAIPRSVSSTAVSTRGRVSRACENCREQKVKCSGQRPSCQRCQESGVQCSYGDRKREKLARRLSDLTARVESFENLLQNIYPNLDSLSAQYVEQILSDQYDNDQPPNHLPSELPSPLFSTDPGSAIGAIDFTDEDFNRDEKIQAMGFVGEHSEIAWMYRLKKILHHFEHGPLGKGLDRNYVTTVNYFLDDAEVAVLDEVDLFQRPLPAVADRLVESYFHIVHPCFPIVSRATFLGQYKSFYSTPSVRPGKRWLAILNLIFAIATKYVHDSAKDTEANAHDHTIYFSRAWKLSMGDVTLLHHPNLQQVQVEGLSAFYLMTVGQANRSWRLSGISIQSAVTMGLNLRNESNIILYSSRETRYRVWWAVYALHVLLCVMTGRLLSSTEDACTTPLPVPFVEEEFSRGEVEQLISDHEARTVFMRNLVSRSSAQSAERALIPESTRRQSPSPGKQSDRIASAAARILTPNVSLHFLYFVELGLIMRRCIDALYAPGAGRKSWRSIEMVISALNSRADSWLAKLPAEFHFLQGTSACERERLSLAFSYYSTKILITQPCLSRILSQVPWDIQSETFCTTVTGNCIDMASLMLELLPDSLDLAWVYRMSPWWCIVHYIMQAITVLLISLLIKAKTNTIQDSRTVDNISKAAGWLSVLAVKDPSAQRAWAAIQDLLSHREIENAMKSNQG
ncbi:putative C6 transcription factor [Aspergillus mulundensis]|uniref:Putative Zn(II)2Cys6 transcription factor n=1 Tax=Aspergillus mulundensis TaxID=1810919 RepID=A0A3D8RKT9_9EURO|nr:putative Zn(II)2Cys6 transcription factor [Aspergillus mulundensis]RDW74665.1 putative Zn(II)2Cys6 transcription factor [Aspergillus mulundensis]